MRGSRSARQMQGEQLWAGTTLHQATQPGAAPTNGPPLSLQYNPDRLHAIPGVGARIAEWERLHLKDGATLTVEERLVLVAHSLGLMDFSAARTSQIIGAVFFGVQGNERDTDNLTTNQVHLVYASPDSAAVFDLNSPVPATARVVFSNGASSFFTGPTKYAGLDTNEREQRVGLARNSFRVAGRRAGYGSDSMVPARRAEFEAAFLADDASKPVRGAVGSPGYNAAFNDFIYDRVLHGYAEKVAQQNVPFLQTWVDNNPPPSTSRTAWVQQLGAQAMSLVLAYNNGNIFAKRHSTWYVEDEAAAQILVEQVQPGVKVNFDVDVPSNIRVE